MDGVFLLVLKTSKACLAKEILIANMRIIPVDDNY